MIITKTIDGLSKNIEYDDINYYTLGDLTLQVNISDEIAEMILLYPYKKVIAKIVISEHRTFTELYNSLSEEDLVFNIFFSLFDVVEIRQIVAAVSNKSAV